MSAPRKPTPPTSSTDTPAAPVPSGPATGTRQQKLLPGAFDSAESRTAFARLQLELETAPHAPLPVDQRSGVTVNEVLLAFMRWAATHYRTPDGEPTTEIGELKWSLRPVWELYGDTPRRSSGPGRWPRFGSTWSG